MKTAKGFGPVTVVLRDASSRQLPRRSRTLASGRPPSDHRVTLGGPSPRPPRLGLPSGRLNALAPPCSSAPRRSGAISAFDARPNSPIFSVSPSRLIGFEPQFERQPVKQAFECPAGREHRAPAGCGLEHRLVGASVGRGVDERTRTREKLSYPGMLDPVVEADRILQEWVADQTVEIQFRCRRSASFVAGPKICSVAGTPSLRTLRRASMIIGNRLSEDVRPNATKVQLVTALGRAVRKHCHVDALSDASHLGAGPRKRSPGLRSARRQPGVRPLGASGVSGRMSERQKHGDIRSSHSRGRQGEVNGAHVGQERRLASLPSKLLEHPFVAEGTAESARDPSPCRARSPLREGRQALTGPRWR